MEKDSTVTKPATSIVTRIKQIHFKHVVFGSRKRIIISLIILLALIFFSYKTFAQTSTKPQYQTTTVQKGTIITSVTENGNVTSGSQAGVGSPTTGIIEEIYVKNGDSVTQGQNLFKVKSTATAQEIASAYATYESAVTAANTATQNKLSAQATLEKDRQAVLDAQDAVDQMNANIGGTKNNPKTGSPYTQNEINSINSLLTSTRDTFTADELKYTQSGQSIASVQASENAAYLAYQATQDSIVTAPVSGTVANITVKAGDQISATSGSLTSNLSSNSSTSTSANAVLSIGNYTNPYIKVQASEVDIPNIKPNQKATITLSAFSGKTFVGTVDQVDTAGTISSGVVTYTVFVSFVAPTDTIKPGMSATVTIETARKDDVLTVPSSAIQTANGQAMVRILQNGKVTSVPVETGITSDTDTEINSGLSEGDTVVTGTTANNAASSNTTSPFSRSFGGGFGGGGGRRGN